MAPMTDDTKTTRRQAVRTVGRWCGLAALTGVAAWLLRRSIRAGALGRSGDSLCAACPALARCTLPRADEARRQGVGLTTPVRVPPPGRPSSRAPLCREGQAAAQTPNDPKGTA